MIAVARAATLTVATFALASTAGADVLYDNFGPGDAYDQDIGWLVGGGNDIQLGAGFVMTAGGDFTLDTVTASIRLNFGPNTVTLTVYDTVDGVPGNALETASASDLPPHDGTDAPPTVFTFSGTTLLLDEETYWIIAHAEPGGDLAWNWNPDHTPGLHAQRQGDEGAWQVFNFEQSVMRVEGTPAETKTAVLFDNFGLGDAYNGLSGWTVGFADNWELGPGFVVEESDNFHLETITAAINWQFEGPNEVTLSVYADDGGQPGALLEAVTMTDLPGIFPTPPPVTFTFSGNTILSGGATYWVAASAPEGSEMGWMDNSTGDIGLHAQRAGGGPWQVFNDVRGAMRVEGTLADTTACPADLTGDGNVGVADLLALLAAWGPNPGHPADLTGDGNVGVADLLELLAQWGSCG